MRAGGLPTIERIGRVLALAATMTGELPAWAGRRMAVMDGRMSVRSRWLALATLLSLHPEVKPEVLGLVLGCAEPRNGLYVARCAPWWSDRLITRLMVQTISLESGSARAFTTAFAAPFTDLVRERLAFLLRDTRHD